MKTYKLLMVLALGLSFLSAESMARKNAFFFINNEVDNEYFVTAELLDPRFSGANTFVKYRQKDQRSLGYMGNNDLISTNNWFDIWLEGSQVSEPFVGSRCFKGEGRCPSDGIVRPEKIKRDGIYKVPMDYWDAQAGYTRGIFSENMYTYLKNMVVGRQERFSFNYCHVSKNKAYNVEAGDTCVSLGGTTRKEDFDITKTGQIRLISTNALQEIFVDQNGNATVGLGSEFCQNGRINDKDGISCRFIDYEQTGRFYGHVTTRMYIAPEGEPKGMAGADIYLGSGDGTGTATWKNYSTESKSNLFFNKDKGHLYVFFTQKYLKALIVQGIDLSQSSNFFTFNFRNSRLPESGFYEFTPSNTILLRPRDYGISIVDKDLILNPTRTGKVGHIEPPIEFEYIVSTSGPRQANEITAQVTGPVHRSNRGVNYCLFSSPDNKIQVPFSAFLSYVDATGRTIKERNSCGDEPMDILPARWEETPWSNAPQEGSFYRTNLKLTFPMNESSSLFSLSGEDWIGVVRAQGEVKVKAIWRGNDVLP